MLKQVSVPRTGVGRPRTRPDHILTDKAYTSPTNTTTCNDAASGANTMLLTSVQRRKALGVTPLSLSAVRQVMVSGEEPPSPPVRSA
ncbi:hypothetical protein [Streptomyces zaomyceticus]|uniref:hypothetical protein n=1 Tax=Streptomyces zaomyceticus TaxID=68286 RepID=UPI0036B1FC24